MTFLHRRTANHLIWALPLLTGTATYLAMRPASATGPPSGAGATAAPVRPAPYHGDLKQLFAETQAALAEKAEASLPPPPPVAPPRALLDLSSLSIAALREKFSDLRTVGRENGPPAELALLLAELIRRDGVATLQWLDEKDDEYHDRAIALLAELDPAAAFEFIVASDRLNPCPRATVLTLLEGQAKADPAALLAAVDRVPWHLFTRSESGDPFGPRASAAFVPEPAAALMWLESGAARHLAEQGIELEGVLANVARTDPKLALENWATWPESPNSSQSGIDFHNILVLAAQKEETANQLRQAIRDAGPDATARIQAALIPFTHGTSTFFTDLRRKLPGVIPESTPPAGKP